MATYITEPSHTFGEYLLLPGYSSTKCIPDNVCLKPRWYDIKEENLLQFR